MRRHGADWIRDRSGLVFAFGAILLLAQAWYAVMVEEFYPSILLPTGGGIVRDDAAFAMEGWLLVAVCRDDARIHLDENALLSTLPAQYRRPLIELGFGLAPESARDPEQAEEARVWLRARVHRQLGRDDVTALEIVRTIYTPSVPAGPDSYVALGIRTVPFE